MFAGSRLPIEGRMGKVEIRIPLVTWRDGRPRFFASAVHRQLGYKGEDLRHGKSGSWFTLDEAIAWSKARQAELAEKRAAIAAGETTVKKTANATARIRAAGLVTISQVMQAFLESPRMQGKPIVRGRQRRDPLSDGTIRFYKGAARCLEKFEDGEVWHEPAADLTGKVLSGLLDAIEQAHGLSQARAVRATISAAFGYGRTKDGGFIVKHNPVADMETTLPVLPPRLRPATAEEFMTLIAVIDALGFDDFGDVVCAGAWTGQRQNDRLALKAAQISADGIMFTPNKKRTSDERLIVPIAKMLQRRIEAAAERRRDWKVKPIGGHVFLREAVKAPWQASWYGKVFRQLRHVAAFGRPETDEAGKITREAKLVLGTRDVAAALGKAGIVPLTSLADLRDQDLRDTCLSWLTFAGADKWQIAGFSGHAFGKDDRILRHYVAVPPEFARAGMAKLEVWFEARLAELEGRKKEAGR